MTGRPPNDKVHDMKIRIPRGGFDVPLNRQAIAECVAGTVDAGKVEGIPYKPNEHDDTYWTVDDGNNWRVRFNPAEPDSLEIIHRYDHKGALTALCGWLAYRLGGTVEP